MIITVGVCILSDILFTDVLCSAGCENFVLRMVWPATSITTSTELGYATVYMKYTENQTEMHRLTTQFSAVIKQQHTKIVK